ncbi:SDR family oxidoreductase [Martelella lutilitoris]|uniref:SDR family oxidoreductase n=1 Tax=Martelella lutilitoris TaxID=2583532 RepID=A0A5C4JRE4_9HYPH|nr:SDR family NAD(P)-dependent oxidoreductase [Martelella lutilitoris]TNB47781.1 SDR family oxidoreductase [Martelella lutilitoris]
MPFHSKSEAALSAARGSLAGRVALVIGAGSIGEGVGIGRAICIAMAREGAHVVAADVDGREAAETARIVREEGHDASSAEVDVLRDESVIALISETLQKFGRIDVLYCNVGLGRSGPSNNTSADDWRRFADANLTSLHVATQAVLPSMREAGRGVILVTSSIASMRFVGFPHLAYSATKAAANHFCRMLAVETAPDGIRVNAIIAGLIDTPRITLTLKDAYDSKDMDAARAARGRQCPMGRMGSVWEVADAAVFLASDRAAYITGTELVVDGGLSATARQPL